MAFLLVVAVLLTYIGFYAETQSATVSSHIIDLFFLSVLFSIFFLVVLLLATAGGILIADGISRIERSDSIQMIKNRM